MKRLALLLLAAAAPAWAGSLKVSNGWIREAPPGAMMLAGYATVSNDGAKALTVCKASSPDFDDVSIHRSSVVNGVSRMEEVPRLKVPAKGQVRLEPGGLHLMLMDPKRELKAGDRVDIRLGCGKTAATAAFEVKSAP